jgi:preprotein translocase subunit SecA
VQYKSKASELFQNLLRDMRSGVISRMFVYRPRNMSTVQSEMHRPTTPEEVVDGLRPSPELSIPTSGDGGEVTEERPSDGIEPETETDEEQVVVNGSQPQLSRSQKRRRHRR